MNDLTEAQPMLVIFLVIAGVVLGIAALVRWMDRQREMAIDPGPSTSYYCRMCSVKFRDWSGAWFLNETGKKSRAGFCAECQQDPEVVQFIEREAVERREKEAAFRQREREQFKKAIIRAKRKSDHGFIAAAERKGR